MRACLDLLVKNGEFRPLWPKEPETKEEPEKPKPLTIYSSRFAKPINPIPARSPPLASTGGPGCTAADETLVVKGHLEGIAKGHWGSGVLQHDIVRMNRAIAGAKAMDDAPTVEILESIKSDLPLVRDPERATAVLEKVEAIVPAVGALAQRCGGAGSISDPVLTADSERHALLRARVAELAEKVKRGEITKEQAVVQVQEEMSVDHDHKHDAGHT